MSTDEEIWNGDPEPDSGEPRLRLRQFREAAGKEPEDLVEFVGNSPSSYYDLESYDDELYSTISLGNLSGLCSALGVKVRDLFGAGDPAKPPISAEQLISQVKAHLNQTGLSVDELSDRIGFKIQPSLADSSKCKAWNVDFLRWVCRELELDWHLALPD